MLQNTIAEAATVAAGAVSCAAINKRPTHDPCKRVGQGQWLRCGWNFWRPGWAGWKVRLFGAAKPGYDPSDDIWGLAPTAMRAVLTRAGLNLMAIDQNYPLTTDCWAPGITGEEAPAALCRTEDDLRAAACKSGTPV